MKATLVKAKYLIGASCLMIAGVVAYLAAFNESKPAKYYLVERETKVRPARFEDLKFHADAGVEMRAPASVDH